MSDIIGQWVGHCSQVFTSGIGDHLVASVPLDENHPFFQPLSQALANAPDASIRPEGISRYVNNVKGDQNLRESLMSFLVAVQRYIKSYANQSGPDGVIETFQRLNTVHTEANRLFGTAGQDGGFQNAFMNPFMVQSARALVRVSQRAASLSPHPPRSNLSSRSIRDTTRQTIEKTFQISSGVLSESDWNASASSAPYMVGDIVWPIANILWRIYAERKLHTQASGLAKSFQALGPNEDRRINSRAPVVNQTDLCETYYWRGRLGVVLLDMRNAKYWLDKAWQLCPEHCYQQRRAILIRLIPVNLLLGHLPTMDTLYQYKLLEFQPLLQAFRQGNVPAFRRELQGNRDWYRSRSIWLILYERGEILVWRNLFRRSLKLYYSLNPEAPKSRCPTWVFVSAARAVFEGSAEVEEANGGMVLEDIICIMSSLIDQSFVLGFLSYSQQQLVMKGGDNGMAGFPRVSQVVPRHIDAIR